MNRNKNMSNWFSKVKNAEKNVYLLVGGGCNTGVSLDKLSDEIIRLIDQRGLKKCKLLFINFGKEEEYWGKTIEKYQSTIFKELIKQGRFDFSIANFNSREMALQFQEADVLFFTGGSEILLKKYIKKIAIPKRGKVIIGNSAGTNIFSVSYFSNDRGRIEEGLGILPLNTICHFTSDKEEFLTRLSRENKFPTFSIEHDEYIKLLF